jgi:hypothetical protein
MGQPEGPIPRREGDRDIDTPHTTGVGTVRKREVAYLAVADKYLGFFAVRLKGCDQPVIRTPNAFSTLHSPRLVGI